MCVCLAWGVDFQLYIIYYYYRCCRVAVVVVKLFFFERKNFNVSKISLIEYNDLILNEKQRNSLSATQSQFRIVYNMEKYLTEIKENVTNCYCYAKNKVKRLK